MVKFNLTDLQFILTQIKMAEAGQPPVNPHLAFGLRTVSGVDNNVVPGNDLFGSADLTFPRMTTPVYQDVAFNPNGTSFDANGAAPNSTIYSSYTQPAGPVFDTAPRTISNLISDQSLGNIAAVETALAQAGSAQPHADALAVVAAFNAVKAAPAVAAAAQAAEIAAGAAAVSSAAAAESAAAAVATLEIVAAAAAAAATDASALLAGLGQAAADAQTAYDTAVIGGDATTIDAALIALTAATTAFGNASANAVILGDLATAAAEAVTAAQAMADAADAQAAADASALAAAVTASDAADASANGGAAHALNVLVAADGLIVENGSVFAANVTPDAGLSAPFNTWMTLFGQFFDHGVDLVTKGGAGTVYIPLLPDDPLFVPGSPTNFMVLTRATGQAGADGLIGTADDNAGTNTITPFVDQSQTYSSHPSHQVFLREYAMGIDGRPHATGRMLDHVNADGSHHMPTWADIKANAASLGILLTDKDVGNIPLLATDAYGNFIPDPLTGMPQMVKMVGGVQTLVSGTSSAPVSTVGAVSTQHAFLNDIAHTAAPVLDAQGYLAQDADVGIAGNAVANDGQGHNVEYDNELLDAHYIAGDGRVNENIGLTAVHEVFHSEHNRLVEQTKDMVRAELALGNTAFVSEWVLAGANLANGIQDSEWNGERLFQVAKFGTETQYQHLVFEEFARKVAPTIHLFGNSNINLDPAITAEFAHAVYRFGHSMLNETINRYEIGADGTPVLDANGHPVLNSIGLIDAFLNPLEFAAAGGDAAGQIVLGSVNQGGNEIDEFVTGALRNNLLGLPLDLAALNIARGRETGVAPLNLLRNQLFAATNDTTLKAYESWDDFGQFLKHAGSLVNFVAAYGTHASILNATTLADKRAAALALVANGATISATPDVDAYDFMHSLGAYANNVLDARAMHATWSTGSVTGLDQVDLWIGGLAEKQNLFGGLLGSTFNFIFETQLESLQDADRLYYLPRIEGIHWGQQIEGNSFAEMIMGNTGVNHLSASIFLTPEYVVEASTIDKNDPSTWLRNPETGKLLVDVMNDGTIRFLGDDNFFGNTMVLGGTAGDDRLLAGQADDDTVYGDGGNDTIDGGNGNDFLYGGAGDDVITDSAGLDVMHGGDGDDNIDGGLDDDIIFGDEGNDFISGGAGIDTGNGGEGNDILLGGEDDDALSGNEGDDWLEGGAGGDMLVGDSGAPTGQIPLYSGNDVLIGGETGDKMLGFSGDDVMTGSGGFDRFDGGLGFDWVSYEGLLQAVSIDMNVRAFIANPLTPAGDATRDHFVETEAASGTNFNDFLQGTDAGRGAINLQGVQTPVVDLFNELNNVNLIFGLSDIMGITGDLGLPTYRNEGPVAFSEGNILLGGAGSDTIEGRGGNDILDGDAALHVSLTSRATGGEIIREITDDGHDNDVDVAYYTGSYFEYSFEEIALGIWKVTDNGQVVTPGVLPRLNNGVDILRNIERIEFSQWELPDERVWVLGGNNSLPIGELTIVDGDTDPVTAGVQPIVGTPLTVDSTFFDPDGITIDGLVQPADFNAIPVADLNLQWQYLNLARNQWVSIAGATGATYTPTNDFLGEQLRVQATYVDGLGYTEVMFTKPTSILTVAPVGNTAPTVLVQGTTTGLADTSARQATALNLYLPLTTTFTDAQTAANQLVYKAVMANSLHALDGSPDAFGLTFTLLFDTGGFVSGARVTGTPTHMGAIDIRVSATDSGPGVPLTVTDVFRINVLPPSGSPGNAMATGTVLISDTTPTEGQLLTASKAFTDVNGVNDASIVYTWQTGSAIDGIWSDIATGTTFAPTDPEVGLNLRVAAHFLDGAGVAEVIYSAPTAAVENVNTPLSGAVVIDGVLFQGETLTANTTGLVDPDGIGELNYVWMRDGAVIGLSNGSTYTLTNNDVNAQISVLVSYIDAHGAVESTTSPLTTPIGNINDVPTGTATATLVDGTEDVSYTVSAATLLQGFTDIDGDVLSVSGLVASSGTVTDNLDGTFTITQATDVNGPVLLVYDVVDGQGGAIGGTQSYTLAVVNDAPVGTANAVLADGAEDVPYVVLDADLLAGFSDADADALFVSGLVASSGTAVHNANGSYTITQDANSSGPVSLSYSVIDGHGGVVAGNQSYVVLAVNDAPTGGVTIDTTAPSLNQTLSVSNTLSDADGLGAISYQWQQSADGSAWTDIAGAVSDTFTITLAQASQQVRAVASYLDAQGNPEAMASDGTTAVFPFNIITSATNGPNLIVGTTLPDQIFGLGGNDIINGGNGNDSIDGGNGNDWLNGQGGNDTMVGGAGNDAFVVNSLSDMVVEASGVGSGTDTVQAWVNNYTLADNVENLILALPSGVVGTGNALNNQVIGNSLNNVLDGGVGRDTLSGGNGDDTYVVDQSDDFVGESLNAGTDTVLSSATYTLSANIENLTLTGAVDLNGTGNGLSNTITGNAAANMLTGAAGADTLVGGGGNDTLIGGVGHDLLTGGADADMFRFDTVGQAGNGAAADVITDFTNGDVISLLLMDADTAATAVGNQSFVWGGDVAQGTAFTAAAQLHAYFDGVNTVVEGNVNANLAADFQIVLQGNHVLTAFDFVL